jgi:hypothetical protein
MLSKEELDAFKPWLKSVALTGSSTLPWINNPRDLDYKFFVENTHKGTLVAKLLTQKPRDECWFIADLDPPSMRIFEYEYEFFEPIYGSEFPRSRVLEDINTYKALIIKLGKYQYTPEVKIWYHILTGIYLIQNGKYELTEDQIKNVQLCHDKRMTPEIYQFIQDQLSIYENELKELAITQN